MPETKYTCPNCGRKFEPDLKALDAHIRDCERTKESAKLQFPKYMVKVSDGKGFKSRAYLPIAEAGRIYDSGSLDVRISHYVLEEDFVVRDITDAERSEISQIAEEYSSSK